MIVVKATFDEEAGVWFTESDDLPGLRIEGASVDDLITKLPDAISDLLEDDDGDGEGDGFDLPVELIAHANTTIRILAAAAA
jgi:hypothetical protein